MRLICRSHGQRLAGLQILGVIAFTSFIAFARGHETTIQGFRAGIEGVYVLQEWHRNGEILRPPVVDARAVLLNGRIVFISRDGAQESNKTTVAGYGIYILEPGKFSYRYEQYSVVTQTAAGISISEELPWEGLRTFAVSVDPDEARFQAMEGPQEFRVTAGGLSYSDGKQMRVYRRVTDE